MKQLTKSLVITLLTVVSLTAAPATEASIRKLLDIMGSIDVSLQAMDQMIGQFKAMTPDAPEEFWSDFRNEISGDDLINLIIPIYQKHLTEEDIQGAIAFYGTPAGQNFIRTLPAVTQESMIAGQTWGQQLGQQLMIKYQSYVTEQEKTKKK